EEQLAIQTISGLHPLESMDLIVVVLDATQLSRNLYLALQIIELGTPVVIALNMVDQLKESGLAIDAEMLAKELGVPVCPVSALKGTGIDGLKKAMDEVLVEPTSAKPGWLWKPTSPELVADIEAVGATAPEEWHRGSDDRRRAFAIWALFSLEEDDELSNVSDELRRAVSDRRALAEGEGRSIEEEVARGRYGWIDERVARVLSESKPERASWTDRLDRVLLHPAVGFAVFLALMTIVFQSLFAWADPVIGLIEGGVSFLGNNLRGWLPDNLLGEFVVDGLVAGVGSVLVFLPQILLLFFFVALMEDSGYMARVAFLMDRLMKAIGLHGRAFVPMLSGYACAVPAILATRTMERRRDRMLTMMVVPLMSCSARLPVYGLLIAALVPVGSGGSWTQGLLLVGMYLFSTLIALVAAFVLGRTIFKGKTVPLLLEMPPYRMPHWGTVRRAMWGKAGVFVKEAGTFIMVCTVAMWLLLTFPQEGGLDQDYGVLRQDAAVELVGDAPALELRLAELTAEESGDRLRHSYGGRLGRAVEPTIEPLGFDWRIGIGLIGAFAAREVFVSTMAVVYGLEDDTDENSTALRERIRAQEWPDGRKVYTPLVCLSLMVFFALACQCMSTLAVIKRETNSYRWPAFAFTYMTALAWLMSFFVYQGGLLLGYS
ncbi:MAG: ferrous iron transport protein B, partial [Planctomycetota bacterium]